MAEEAVVEVPEETSTPEVLETDEQVENTEEATNSESAEDAGEPARKNQGVGKRINELTREKYEIKREAERLRAEVERLSQQRQQPQQAAEGKPTPDQYQTFEDYQEALVDYRLGQKLEAERRERMEREAVQRQAEARTSWSQREEQARERLVDYDAVVYPMLDIPVVANNPFIADALVDSPIGADVLYYLGKNPNEAIRIANLNPAACAREIGKIEAKLETQAKPQSKAPTPPKPVSGVAKAVDGLRDDISAEEWVKRRNEQLYKR